MSIFAVLYRVGQAVGQAVGLLKPPELLELTSFMQPSVAQRRIAENKRTMAPVLDLGNCGLSEIPSEIGEMIWLETLSLGSDSSHWDGNGWHRVPCFYGGEGITKNIDLADISVLAHLRRLRILAMRGTAVTDLTPLRGLTELVSLDFADTAVSDLAPLASLKNLKALDITGTQVDDLLPLSGLDCLELLWFEKTQVKDIAPISKLVRLIQINARATQISNLSTVVPLIQNGLEINPLIGDGCGNGLNLQGCPLTNPPLEIVAQGTKAVLNYFAESKMAGVTHMYEAKMLILGEGGAGKTSLLRRLYLPQQPLPAEDETTKGIAIHRHDFKLKNGQPFRLNVWDFGGQEVYHATHQFFLTHRSLYLLLDDTRKDHKSVSDPGFKYWLDLIELFGGHSPVLMFQNEKGGRSKEIDLAGIKGQFDNVKECYRGNLEQENAADQLREGIELFASQLTHIGDELPVAWIKIRAAIEERAVQVPHISIQEYFDLYSRFLPFDQTKARHLSRYLHDLGVFLHFQDEDDSLLSRIVILQNPWATEAVYRILDDETVKAKRGRFDRADCKRAWGAASYAAMHPELLALMQRFELCYELPASKPQTWLAPQLLAAAKPTQLHDWNRFDDLVLRYHYDFLPKGTLSRLMVRLHRFVLQPDCASINCVLFERETTVLLAELLPSGNDLALRARGPESKALLSVVAAELDAINDGLPGLAEKVNKLIPCNCEQCRNAPEPEFFPEKLLLRRKQALRNKIECQRSFTEVDGLALLDGIKIAEFPGWAMPEPSAPPLRTIKIFLSPSTELLDECDAFELYFRQQNDHYRQQGVYLEIVRRGNLSSAVAATRMQDEYNQAIRKCDIFLSLFFTKAGQFSDEEFDAAHAQFKATGLPYIFTYFKAAEINMGSVQAADLNSLWAFKDKLTALGHNPNQYSNIEHLKRQFSDQLKKLLQLKN